MNLLKTLRHASCHGKKVEYLARRKVPVRAPEHLDALGERQFADFDVQRVATDETCRIKDFDKYYTIFIGVMGQLNRDFYFS